MNLYGWIGRTWAFALALQAPLLGGGQQPSTAPSVGADSSVPVVGLSIADELNNENVDIQFLQDRVKRDPGDMTAWNNLGALYLTKLRQTGLLSYIDKADEASRASLQADPTARNFGGVALRARAEFERHQFSAARDDGVRLSQMAPSRPEAWLILGNALYELGEYDQAAAAWKEMQQIEPVSYPVENCLSRLAYLHGDLAGARKHLKTALELVRASPVPSADTLCWCFVQLGQLDFMTGDWASAEKNYQAALALNPNSYLALEHVAELQGGRQKYEEAAAIYGKVIAQVPRPEFYQALGDIYTFANDTKQAAVWHEKALAGFLAGGTNGNVYFCHHLAGFFSDSSPNPAEAVKWARKDMEMRHSIYAWDALAWALYGAGQMDEALNADKNALALGTRDSHLLYHASLILISAGQIEEGRARLQQAAAINPNFNAFHVHRF